MKSNYWSKLYKALIFAALNSPRLVLAESEIDQAQVEPSPVNIIETLTVIGRAGLPLVGQQTQERENRLQGLGLDAGESLQGFRGLQVDTRANFAQDTRLSLRGFGARSAFGVRGIYLMADGIPLTMPDGQGQLSGVLLDTAREVQVLSGPVAAVYGNAAGGVVQLTTSKPEESALEIVAGNDELGAERQLIIGKFRDENVAAIAAAAQTHADGVRPHSSAEKQQEQAQIFYALDNGLEFHYKFDHERDPLLQDPLGLTAAQWAENPYQKNQAAETFDTRKSIEQTQNALVLKQTQGAVKWQLSRWQGKRNIEQFLAQSGDALSSSGGVVDLHRQYTGVNGNATWSPNSALDLTLGFSRGEMQDERLGFVNNKDVAGAKRRDETNQAKNADVYGLAQWQVSSRWRWLLGVRRAAVDFGVNDRWIIVGKNKDDSGKKSFDDQTAALTTTYQLNERWSLSAATGTGFETPTLAEMAYTTKDQGFNNNLQAANNRQQQLSLEYRSSFARVHANAFSIYSDDEVVVDQSLNGRTSYRNAGKTERYGRELSAELNFSAKLTGSLAYTYVDAVYASGVYQGNQLPGVAKQNGYLLWRYRPFAKIHLVCEWQSVYRAQTSANDDNLLWAPSYHKQDVSLRSRWQWQENSNGYWEVWGLLSNIMNTSYVGSVIVNQSNGRAFEAAEPRHWSLGLKLNLNFH